MSGVLLLFLTVWWWLVEYGVGSAADGSVVCYPFSRASTFSVDLEGQIGRLREVHVRHNLKGQVVLEDSVSDGHLLTVSVIADASSEAMLDQLQVTHRLLEVTDRKSVLLLQADFGSFSGGDWFAFYHSIWIASGALVLAATIGVIWMCYKWRQRRIIGERSTAREPEGNTPTLTESQRYISSTLAYRKPLSSSTSGETQFDINPVNNSTTPLAMSIGRFQTMQAFHPASENPASRPDALEQWPEPGRALILPHDASADLRFSSSSSARCSRRVETTSILTVMVIAVVISAHAICIPDHRVQLIIKLPQNLLLDHVKVFYSEKYNNPVDAKAWNQSGSILHIYDLLNSSATSNRPCDDELSCPGVSSSSDLPAACDWSTGMCICPRGSAMVNDMCRSLTVPTDSESGFDELFDNQVATSASSNLFLENLHNARNLETTYYVTDAKQLTDFFWYRDSGIRVNVGLQNIDVIPTYEDVDHDGDSDFVMQNPSAKSEIEYFRNIQFSYCRYPMPDYYSLTLEIAKDRMTKASMEVCTMEKYYAGSCQEGRYVGENYIKRELNEPCHKMGSFPEPLLPAANSIVCTESTSLLTALFNVTPATVQSIPLVSDACRMAGIQCDQCLNQPRCQLLADDLDRACCQLDCYIKPECKLATSLYCRNPPLECARGDSYRYTLQPIFGDVRSLYQCHLHHKMPAVLYELWFYVSIPGSDFETPRIYSSVQLSEAERRASQGQHQHEFLTVEYMTDIELGESLILVGKQQEPGIWNHVVHPVGRSLFGASQSGILYELVKNVYVASVNFDEPFAFSSSTWVTGDNCRKNVSKFVTMPPESDVVAQPVSVSISNLPGQPYKYLIKSANSPPSMRVLIPGNTSLLRWWFRDKPPFLIIGSSLQVNLTFNESSMLINIQGFLTGCPGYLGIVIEDLLLEAEIVKYDILVSCPQKFSVVFMIPNQDPSVDRTVEVLIDDAKQISQFILAYNPALNQRPPNLTFTKEWKAAVFVTFGLFTILFTASLGLIFLAAICWTCWKSVCLACQKVFGKDFEALAAAKQNVPFSVPEGGQRSWKSKDSRLLTFKSMNIHQRILLVLYIVSKVLTIIFCTFTVLFILLNAFVGQKTNYASDAVEELQRKGSDKMDLYEPVLEEQINKDLTQQSEFLRQLYDDELRCVQAILNMTKFHLDKLTKAFNATSVMASRLRRQILVYWKKMEVFTDRYRKKFDNDIYPHMNRYHSYLDLQARNQWLIFPRRLFNLSLSVKPAKNSVFSKDQPSAKVALSAIAFTFWDFVGVQEVIRAQSWPKTFWNKYFEEMSSSIHQKSIISTERDQSCIRNSSAQSTRQNSSDFHRFNSSRYFAMPWKAVRKTVNLPNVDLHSDFRTYSDRNSFSSSSASSLEDSDSFSLVVYLHIDIFRIVFFFVDIVLLLQRCTQLYLQTQSMFVGFKCRAALSPSRFWRLRLAMELNGDFSPPSLRRQANSKQANSKLYSPNQDRSVSDGVLLVTRPTSGLQPYTIVTCSNTVSIMQDGSCTSLQPGSEPFSTVNIESLESSKSLLSYFDLLLRSVLVQRLEMAVFVVTLHFILLTSVDQILLSFADCYPQILSLYRDLVNVSTFPKAFGWQHMIHIAHWHKAQELSEFHASLSSLLIFVKEQEEYLRNFQHDTCSLFPDGVDKTCDSLNVTERYIHEDVAGTRFPCSYSFNYSRLNSLPEFNVSCVKNLTVLARSADDVITAFWQVFLLCVLTVIVLHTFGTVILHFVKKSNIFPVRYVYETSASGLSHSTSGCSHADKRLTLTPEKSEATGCKLELPAVYRIMSTTTPDTSPSSESNFAAAASRRSRVRFAPTVQVSSANSSFGSIPTQMQAELGYAESNV